MYRVYLRVYNQGGYTLECTTGEVYPGIRVLRG